MFFNDFDVLVLKIKKQYMKKIILIYFQVKNIFLVKK